MVSRATVIRTVVFQAAKEVMEWLHPENSHWGVEPRHWIFRGHSDANYRLIPTSLRTGQVLAFRPNTQTRAPLSSHEDQVTAENRLLYQFKGELDRRGLQIPEDGQHLRCTESIRWMLDRLDRCLKGCLAWPPPELRSIAALAQHYGIPTRLLDWTRNAYVSAYFAAIGAASTPKRQQAPDLGVWALQSSFLIQLSITKAPSSIEIVTAPTYSNPNLKAQLGVFTLHRVLAGRTDPVVVEPHNEAVAREASHMTPEWFDENNVFPTVMYHVRLPTSQAPELLRLLSYRGVDAGGVFPGHSGAAQAIIEERYWDQLSSPALSENLIRL